MPIAPQMNHVGRFVALIVIHFQSIVLVLYRMEILQCLVLFLLN